MVENRMTRTQRYQHAKRSHHKKQHARRWGMVRAFVGAVSARPLLWGALCISTLVALMLVSLPAAGRQPDSLEQALALSSGKLEVKGTAIAERAVNQKFQIHMEETTETSGVIPYENIWVLNDPFFPLIGNPGVLRDNEGKLDSKLGFMLKREDPEAPQSMELDAGGHPVGGGSTTQTTTGATLGASTQAGNVVLVEEIKESRGIMYARIKVGGQTYDDVRSGVVFADNYQIAEFKDRETVVLLCGDERYELKVGQLRRI
jgi:hypothetical protein